MGNPMRIRAAEKDGVTEVKVLMNHEMETGQRKDSSGNLIPAHFISELTAKHGDKVVLQAGLARRYRRTLSCRSSSRVVPRATRWW